MLPNELECSKCKQPFTKDERAIGIHNCKTKAPKKEAAKDAGKDKTDRTAESK